VSPFFFWGTSMVAMKQLAPHTTPLLVASWRLIPAGLLLLVWAQLSGRQAPKEPMAWVAVALFGLVDAACFQASQPPSQSCGGCRHMRWPARCAAVLWGVPAGLLASAHLIQTLCPSSSLPAAGIPG
jgi:hypothetical protein